MTKAERAAHVATRLEELYPETPIPLDHTDVYTLLIAVLLSAQCTDERVNKITPALFAIASTPQTMAKVPVGTIRDIINHVVFHPESLSLFLSSLKFWSRNTTAPSRMIWKLLNLCQGSGIRPPLSS